ncbi:hypothetical protein C0995_004179 [Termitomyces sp. Mi166|nr:hypothetical protein C0995_004179 [Termitomyces sp. Mi166\
MDRTAVFVYSPRFIDEKSPTPPSPTSSLRGVFTRSRPVSFAPSECPTIASNCLTISHVASNSPDHSSDVSTPATTTTFIEKKSKTPQSKVQFRPDEMGIEIATTSGLKHIENNPPLTTGKSKRPSWQAIRRTVSHILHGDPNDEKEKDIPLTSISSPRALKPSKSASLKLKSSSASIYTQRSSGSEKRLTITPPPRVLAQQQAQVLARRKRLRHSRSFSEYPNVLVAIADESSDIDTDAGLDEATMEAQEMMKNIRREAGIH